MSRIIINNDSDWVSDAEAVELCADIIRGGRVSGLNKDRYAYLTVYKSEDGCEVLSIAASLNKGSDSFFVRDYPGGQ